MEKLTFRVQQFEGPLDLLLHLISKNKIDIRDIPIAALLEQYLDAIDQMKRQDLEIASEFLEMAARLVYIKTVMLLPKQEEAQALKEELTGQLIEYAACKKAAVLLRKQYVGGDIFIHPPMQNLIDDAYTRVHEPQLLRKAYLAAIGRRARLLPPPKAAFEGIIQREFVPVETKEREILQLLKTGTGISLRHLYELQTERSGAVAVFLALLELMKSGKITLDDRGRIFSADIIQKEEPEHGQLSGSTL